jgi:hypothetical protein
MLLNLCLKHHNPIKKPTTNKVPVILLNIKVEDMYGTRFSTESKFFLSPNPDFIIKGMPRRLIKDIKGNRFADTPIIIAAYETSGKIQKRFAAFCFPTAMTNVFLPLDLSAS